MVKLTDETGTNTEIGQYVADMVRQAFDDLDKVQCTHANNNVDSKDIAKNLHYAISELTRAQRTMEQGRL